MLRDCRVVALVTLLLTGNGAALSTALPIRRLIVFEAGAVVALPQQLEIVSSGVVWK